MTPSILDYNSDCPTFSLAFSPLYQDTSNLKLAIGSYNDNRGDNNNVTVIELNPNYLDLNDQDLDLLEQRQHSYSHSYHQNQLSDDEDMEGDYLSKSSLRRNSNSSHHSNTSNSITPSAFNPIARAPHPYPPSAIGFSPARLSSSLQSSTQGTKGEVTREMLASSSECLRLWDLVGDDNEVVGRSNGFIGSGRSTSSGSRLVQRAVLANSKQDYSAPLTSFSWSTLEPTHIVTSSIDTTCTVWDISTSVPITQLIAHDREVYDVAWSPASREVFASVGADGSVRMFDLRSLEHSTILYEATQPSPSSSTSKSKPNGTSPTSPKITSSSSSSSTALPSPLLRLAFSPTAPTYVSVVHADSADVQILDTRNPGTPAMEVRGHKAAVNGMAWGGSTMTGGSGETVGPGWLATCSDDSTILLWDLSTTTPLPPPVSRSAIAQPKIIMDPVVSYSAPSEVNSIAWGGGGEWVAAGCGRLVRLLKV